jgi:hypothetical protein
VNDPEPRPIHAPTDWRGFTLALFVRIQRELDKMLADSTTSDLRRRVRADANPVGWLAWHLTRSHDRNMSEIAGIEQCWTANGWADRFGRATDPNETGYGHTSDHVNAFDPPDAVTILGYHDDVMSSIEQYFAAAPADDLQRATTSPTLGTTVTVAKRIEGVINEGFQHLGQIAITLGRVEPSAAIVLPD